MKQAIHDFFHGDLSTFLGGYENEESERSEQDGPSPASKIGERSGVPVALVLGYVLFASPIGMNPFHPRESAAYSAGGGAFVVAPLVVLVGAFGVGLLYPILEDDLYDGYIHDLLINFGRAPAAVYLLSISAMYYGPSVGMVIQGNIAGAVGSAVLMTVVLVVLVVIGAVTGIGMRTVIIAELWLLVGPALLGGYLGAAVGEIGAKFTT